jgi:YD repeat-containing protein
MDELLTNLQSGKDNVEYQYDEAGRVITLIYPDGKSVLYQYDANDNITLVTNRNGQKINKREVCFEKHINS